MPGELTDEALQHRLFAHAGVKQGYRRLPEPDWGQLACELKKPGVNLTVLFDEYRAIHPDGYGYSRFCELFRGFAQRLSPTMRQTHVAGDKVFVDYSGKKVPIVDPSTGVVREAEIFEPASMRPDRCSAPPASPTRRRRGRRRFRIGSARMYACCTASAEFRA